MIPKHKLAGLVLLALPLFSFAQENSPYSRYGIGNIVPTQNLLNRGMGGISAGFSHPQSINFSNPASYPYIQLTTLDVGAEVDSRTIIQSSPIKKFTANNAIISYLQLAVPLINAQKAFEKKTGWGLNFGLRPTTKINYKIQNNHRISNIDSAATLFEGTGGINEAFVGTGVRIKNFSFGVNAGYLFGNRDYSTRVILINDSIDYFASNSATKTHIGGIFFNAGVQYKIPFDKDEIKVLRIGAFGRTKQNIDATRDIIRETFTYNAVTDNPDKIDSVYESNGEKGQVTMPASFTVGFTYQNAHVLYGLDFEMNKWDDYRYYGSKDLVQNSWTLRGGVQFYPASSQSKKYWNFVHYRAGFSIGPDYINIGKELPQFNLTFGAGFPLKLRRAFYEAQVSTMNLAIEYGRRGNKDNGVRESLFRIGLGFSLSDLWFRRYKYD